MRGLMMDWPLLVSRLIRHADLIHGERPVVSRETDGLVRWSTWREVHRGSRRLANALTALGLRHGDRIGTLAWNDLRHLELYYAVSGMGAVCHTMNPRLHPAQLAWVVNHAEDRWLFVDTTFVPLVEAIWPGLKGVEGVVVMAPAERMPDTKLPRVLCYDTLVGEHDDAYDWPVFDEHTAAALCYTSGTTGQPKGVLYSHRSTVLHAFGISLPGVLPLVPDDVFLPVVPMFHANAWGTAYSTAMNGTALVLPGPGLDGKSLTALMNEAGVTCTAGVPTVWMGLLNHWRQTGERVPSLKSVLVGGAAPPPSMVRAFVEEFGVEFRHGWGMTEMSPLGSLNALHAADRELPPEERVEFLTSQGRPPFGVEMRILGEAGEELPWDGSSFGELQVRGPWVCSGYYLLDDSDAHDGEGWFSTGDVATLDGEGRMRITDRKKDVIKSGGEWISSIELENLAMSHPDVAHAAVVGVPHAKWGERPVLFVVPKPGRVPVRDELLGFYEGKVATWWIPDDVVVRDELPVGGTGKVQKVRLREAWLAETEAREPEAAPRAGGD